MIKKIICLFAVGLSVFGCGKKQNPITGTGPIQFTDADISINVGAGWTRIEKVSEGMCSPILAGKPGLIQAYWARSEFKNIETIIENSKKEHSTDAYEEKDFISETGLKGKYLYVVIAPTKKEGKEQRLTKFLVLTRSGRIFILDFIGWNETIYDTTKETIIRTISNTQK